MILQIPVQILCSGEHPQTRSNGLAGALRMRDTLQPEESKHAVAIVSVDNAVIGEDRVAELFEETVERVNDVVGKLALGDCGETADVTKEQSNSFFLRRGPCIGLAASKIGIDGVMHESANLRRTGWTALAREPHGVRPVALHCQLDLLRRARAERLQAVDDQYTTR